MTTHGVPADDDALVDPRNSMRILPELECWDLLTSHSLGRLALSVAGQPEIFPVNYVTHERHILFRTAEGTKLTSVVVNARVAFEIDGYDAASGEAWSVVVTGLGHVLHTLDEVYPAERLPLVPWNASPKDNYVRIAPTEISGRRFSVVEDQRPETDQGV
jgi:nitroimidazol reductase NimA-like FMN-containing flavoprotein (pyridoxamine 5'-phosphate oxidase superfamily)